MIYYFIVLRIKQDLRPHVAAIWYTNNIEKWMARYDVYQNKLEGNNYILYDYD